MAEADPKLADNAADMTELEATKPRRNWRKLGLMLSLPIALLIGGLAYWQSLQGQVSTDNAYVHLDKVSISAQVGGQIVDVLVKENQHVKAGDLLFRVDPEPFRLQVAQADAAIASAQANEIAAANSSARSGADISAARENIAFARTNLVRQEALWKKGFTTKAAFDAAQQQVPVAHEQLRLAEAKRLVDTDHHWSRVMSAPTTQAERDGTEVPRIIRQFKDNLEFTGGTAVQYDKSYLFANSAHQALANKEVIGRRFHSAPVVRVSDAKQMQLGHVAEADARWRIYAFAGQADSSAPGSAIHQLAGWLQNDPNSPVVKHTRPGEDIDAVIDVRAVFQQTFDQLAYEDMPEFFKPKTGKLGLQDHEKIFCVDHKGVGDIYDMRGIDRQQGCMIVVRPDQYVAHVLPLNGYQELSAYFANILR